MQWLYASWLSPHWLWLLGALSIPLLVHLLRRRSPRQITFAAAHWLLPKHRRSQKRWLLRDKPLLALRLLLIALLVLALAQPLLPRDAGDGSGLLLVDPRVGRTELREFLAGRDDIARAEWLQRQPRSIDAPRPPAPDLWRTLGTLAARAEYRRAQILLRNAQNPSGYRLLETSPHWQWHALQRERHTDNTVPQIAVLGPEPQWLRPAIDAIAEQSLSQVALQPLHSAATLDPRQQDWLIYNNAGELPAAVRAFVEGGGLLISDRRVQSAQVPFTAVDGQRLEAAAIGRGSWLRYRDDWHSAGFYHRADLPRRLWREWSAQDWARQADGRPRWSIDAPPARQLPDTAVTPARPEPLSPTLLIALALLLALERLLALRRPESETGSGPDKPEVQP
ncbi:BatA domain-containing protein [Microbulbifer litoralis]|uniref:BatA domain-containing protein n=1 Tax=Microbulbifer litoralis TaxID=2933965 RepID=UPI0020282E8D|nr:BatA domain-containing protein [Microbulbifer sp. GX H0434]